MPPTTVTGASTRRSRDGTGAAIAVVEPARAEIGRAPPPLDPGLVPRPRLVDRLLESTDAPLVLVVAPAGFGKTALLSDWASRDARRFEWISLADVRADSDALTATVARALGARPPGERLAAVPARARWTRPTVLVVDDAELPSAPGSLRRLAGIVERLPHGSQLVLASRTEPALPVGRLRAHRKLVELRAPELAMTRSEATALLRASGLRLSPDQVAALVRRTEGWPAGLYLAALAVGGQTDAGRAVSRFAGDDRAVADYLREELLAELPRDRLDFLRRTSVLDRLSGPLCDALLGRRDSAGVLAELARSELLLVRLDRTDEWFRYHSLLAGTLRTELRRLEPDRERELHARASAWFAEHGEPARAIDHAIAAGDAQRVGELIWQSIPRRLPGRDASVKRWLESFTREEIADEPALALVAAAANLTTGDGNQLRHWAAAAARGLGQRGTDGGAARLEPRLAGLRASICERGMRAMGEDAASAYRREPEDSPWRASCRLFEGVAQQLTGRGERARVLLEEGARRGAVGAPTVHTLCLAQLALLALDDGDLASAEALAGRALAQVERLGIGDCPTQAAAFAASAAVRATSGRVEDATRDLRHSQRLLAALTDFVPWYEAEVRAALARAAVRLSDVTTARALAAEAQRFLRQLPDAVVLARWLDEVRAQADTLSESVGGRGWSLTTAELRVLQFLPSHLSFPEIAERLYVSPNTVKTHARAVYRKLDASSRAEAVERAREAGFVPAPA
jgi:LuxR family maltose regulon positive regulatory protein